MEELKDHLSNLRAADVDLGLEGLMESLAKMRSELNKLRSDKAAPAEEV